MKYSLYIVTFLMSALSFGQNIAVDWQTFTPQQLIEDILIDSDCIDNIMVTNVVGGNFSTPDESYGYFDAAGTSFPFESGIVLSTGKLSNVPGPNASLSDDDAPGWAGDADLEFVLDETETTNATILEFDFTSSASEVSFRYLFASEEYQENNNNTCLFSDLFGFLVRPIDDQAYTNIALVPGTQTPVKVTTVHPNLPGCSAQNVAYFGGFNDVLAPINFNGQTTILTATASIVPNETYHVKLVVADEKNFRFDSAVFLEAGSFRLSTNLGEDFLIDNGNPLCGDETYLIETNEPGASNTYRWFKDEVEIAGETGTSLLVSDGGLYSVEISKDTCLLFGDITIEYSQNPEVFDAVLVECDQDQDGLTTYNLFDIESMVTNTDTSLVVSGFFLSESDAEQNINAIPNPTNFQNTSAFQTVYALVFNPGNCTSIAEVELQISNNVISIPSLEVCDDLSVDGFANFDLTMITSSIADQIPMDAEVTFYISEDDAFLETNALSSPFENTIQDEQTIFVKVVSNNQCFAIATVDLEVLYTPLLQEDESFIYCLNRFPETLTLVGGVLNDLPNNYYYEWLFNGTMTSVNTLFFEANEPGIYTVIVTDPNGCSSSRMLTVLPSDGATIEDITVSEGTFNNTVTIQVSGDNTYEFALDDPEGPYQNSNTFSNVAPGFHTVFVRDIEQCTLVDKVISVLGFPKFFTPNGDPFNERWQVYGVNSEFNQGITISIFNRRGKLITQFDNESAGWDGTLNGQALPSDDYWFTVKLIDGRTFTGHFALRR
ncbi:MAG: choice-of-anchor L domain-containing protein [Psychroserpens sp.]|uniref:choice-of-anchor L domain-containing protein n=1 Tax=Psychroserpens sp. TaxID=2020870 RepID=UPI003C765556